jgi:hypothetical protein
MDVEFVNEFIATQKLYIDDYLAKNILLETRIRIMDAKLRDTQEKLDSAIKQIEKMSKKDKGA